MICKLDSDKTQFVFLQSTSHYYTDKKTGESKSTIPENQISYLGEDLDSAIDIYNDCYKDIMTMFKDDTAFENVSEDKSIETSIYKDTIYRKRIEFTIKNLKKQQEGYYKSAMVLRLEKMYVEPYSDDMQEEENTMEEADESIGKEDGKEGK